MAKYFLGSVGKAEAFKRDENGNLKLAFVSKTLTDSGLNITTTKDDIRAGEGAPVQFSFYHDSNVEITLTDVLWKPEYLEAQLGANFVDGSEDYVTRTVDFSAGTATFNEKINKMPIPCGEEYVVWGAPQGSDEWDLVTYDGESSLTLAGAHAGKTGTFCIRFLGAVTTAKVAEITSTIIPEELFLIITAPIFAGDACAASKGKAAGHITFEVPRFQLNGAQEFTMNMSQNQTMSLAGIALASESADCEANGGKLLRIIEVIDGRDWKSSVSELIVDEDCLQVGKTPVVYALKNDGSLVLCDNADIIYNTDNSTTTYQALLGSAIMNTDGTFKTANTYYINLRTGTSGTTPAVKPGAIANETIVVASA